MATMMMMTRAKTTKDQDQDQDGEVKSSQVYTATIHKKIILASRGVHKKRRRALRALFSAKSPTAKIMDHGEDGHR
jgi:hypothetical protein